MWHIRAIGLQLQATIWASDSTTPGAQVPKSLTLVNALAATMMQGCTQRLDLLTLTTPIKRPTLLLRHQ